MADIHVRPRSEYHELSMSCWCKPSRDSVEPRVVVHVQSSHTLDTNRPIGKSKCQTKRTIGE